MEKFKVGDKVIVVNEESEFYGLVGVVQKVEGCYYFVKFKQHYEDICFRETSIELVDVDDDSFEEYMKSKKVDEEIKKDSELMHLKKTDK